ncbi:MAG: hypothetical protein R3B84_22165 [Zavarzinella sp.]
MNLLLAILGLLFPTLEKIRSLPMQLPVTFQAKFRGDIQLQNERLTAKGSVEWRADNLAGNPQIVAYPTKHLSLSKLRWSNGQPVVYGVAYPSQQQAIWIPAGENLQFLSEWQTATEVARQQPLIVELPPSCRALLELRCPAQVSLHPLENSGQIVSEIVQDQYRLYQIRASGRNQLMLGWQLARQVPSVETSITTWDYRTRKGTVQYTWQSLEPKLPRLVMPYDRQLEITDVRGNLPIQWLTRNGEKSRVLVVESSQPATRLQLTIQISAQSATTVLLQPMMHQPNLFSRSEILLKNAPPPGADLQVVDADTTWVKIVGNRLADYQFRNPTNHRFGVQLSWPKIRNQCQLFSNLEILPDSLQVRLKMQLRTGTSELRLKMPTSQPYQQVRLQQSGVPLVFSMQQHQLFATMPDSARELELRYTIPWANSSSFLQRFDHTLAELLPQLNEGEWLVTQDQLQVANLSSNIHATLRSSSGNPVVISNTASKWDLTKIAASQLQVRLLIGAGTLPPLPMQQVRQHRFHPYPMVHRLTEFLDDPEPIEASADQLPEPTDRTEGLIANQQYIITSARYEMALHADRVVVQLTIKLTTLQPQVAIPAFFATQRLMGYTIDGAAVTVNMTEPPTLMITEAGDHLLVGSFESPLSNRVGTIAQWQLEVPKAGENTVLLTSNTPETLLDATGFLPTTEVKLGNKPVEISLPTITTFTAQWGNLSKPKQDAVADILHEFRSPGDTTISKLIVQPQGNLLHTFTLRTSNELLLQNLVYEPIIPSMFDSTLSQPLITRTGPNVYLVKLRQPLTEPTIFRATWWTAGKANQRQLLPSLTVDRMPTSEWYAIPKTYQPTNPAMFAAEPGDLQALFRWLGGSQQEAMTYFLAKQRLSTGPTIQPRPQVQQVTVKQVQTTIQSSRTRLDASIQARWEASQPQSLVKLPVMRGWTIDSVVGSDLQQWSQAGDQLYLQLPTAALLGDLTIRASLPIPATGNSSNKIPVSSVILGDDPAQVSVQVTAPMGDEFVPPAKANADLQLTTPSQAVVKGVLAKFTTLAIKESKLVLPATIQFHWFNTLKKYQVTFTFSAKDIPKFAHSVVLYLPFAHQIVAPTVGTDLVPGGFYHFPVAEMGDEWSVRFFLPKGQYLVPRFVCCADHLPLELHFTYQFDPQLTTKDVYPPDSWSASESLRGEGDNLRKVTVDTDWWFQLLEIPQDEDLVIPSKPEAEPALILDFYPRPWWQRMWEQYALHVWTAGTMLLLMIWRKLML